MLNTLPSEGWQFWLYLRQSFLHGFLKSRWPSSNNYYPEILKLCCVSVTGSRCPPLTAGGTCCCTTPGPGAGAETTWTSSWTTAPSSGHITSHRITSHHGRLCCEKGLFLLELQTSHRRSFHNHSSRGLLHDCANGPFATLLILTVSWQVRPQRPADGQRCRHRVQGHFSFT